MLRWLILSCVALVALGGEIDQKFVLDGDKDFQKAQIKLYQAKILFLENEQLSALQKTYQLTGELEHTLQYYLVVVTPVTSKVLKEKLAVYSTAHYKNALFIQRKHPSKSNSNIHIPQVPSKRSVPKTSSMLERIGIGMEWIAIWLLSVVGLILSIYRRRTIAHLQDAQKEMSSKEEKIEKEIESLEV